MPTKKEKDILFIVTGSLCAVLLGFFATLLTGSSELYRNLNNPPLSPPPFLFAAVWSVLYVIIGGATGKIASLTSEETSDERAKGISLSCISFLFNLLWYPLFFGKGQFAAALIDIAVIFLLTLFSFSYYKKLNKVCAYLLIPYFIWLVFAFYLNLGVILLN